MLDRVRRIVLGNMIELRATAGRMIWVNPFQV
jgi:hypothetical protein